VVIRLNGEDRAQFEGDQLAGGPLDKHDLSRPITLREPAQKPPAPRPRTCRPAPAAELHHLPADGVTGEWDYRTCRPS
jgi:hypothetical protein